jgi:hypothetical protein
MPAFFSNSLEGSESENECLLVFWDDAPHSLVAVYRRSRSACCLHHQDIANSSGTSVHFYQTTRHNIPEDRHLHTRGRENMKSHPEGNAFRNGNLYFVTKQQKAFYY